MKQILSLLLVLNCWIANSQQLISPVVITLPAKPSSNTADWTTGVPGFTITAQTKLRNNQVPGEVVESRILVTIKKGGKVCGTYTQQTAPASNFNSLSKSWSGASALALLGQTCSLPTGSYELWVQFYHSNPAAGNGLLGEGFKPFIIEDPKQQIFNPPQNILPVDGKKFTAQEAKLPISFKWTPVSPLPNEDIIYKLRLVEAKPGQTKAQALKSNTPFEILEVKKSTQVTYKLANRLNGICWDVEAVGVQRTQTGNPRSYGKSEGSGFRINPTPDRPADICNDVQVRNTSIDCQAFPKYLIHDQIINSSGKNIVSWTMTSDAGTLDNLLPQTIGGNTTVSTAAIGFSGVVQNAGEYIFATYTFTFDDNTTCTNSVDYKIPECNQPCACGQWVNVRFLTTNIDGAPVSFGRNCGGNDTVDIRPDANFTIAPGYTCTGTNCQVSYRYDVFLQNGTALYTNVEPAVMMASEMNTCGEVYKIVIKPTCNGQSCPPCTVYLRRSCPPSCLCTGQPAVFKRTASGGPLREIPFACNPATPYINNLSCTANDTLIVRNFCTGNCPASGTSLHIDKPDGTSFDLTPFSVFPGETWFVLPPSGQTGIYSITVKTSCGTQSCTDCKIDFQQTCIPPGCDCGSWGAVSMIGSSGGFPTQTRSCLDTFSISSNEFYYLSGYQCTGNPGPPYYCRVSYTYDVFKSDGTAIYTNHNGQISGAILSDCNEIYRVVIKPFCKGISCSACTVYIKRVCPPACVCGNWSDTRATFTLLGTLNAQSPVDCGKQFTVDCNTQVTISGNFQCTGTCSKSDSVFVYDPTGQLIKQVAGSDVNFTASLPTNLKPYTVILKSACGTTACPPCSINVYTRCIPDIPCKCDKWGAVTINNKAYDCGSKIPWKCNTPADFSTLYSCSPDNKACQAEINWVIKEDNTNTIIKTGTGTSYVKERFTPTSNGSYTIYFNALCDNKKCPPPCPVTLVVTDCGACNCEQFKFSGTVTATGKNKENRCTYTFNGMVFNPCEEKKVVGFSASAGISLSPSSLSLAKGNNPVQFDVISNNGTSSGYILAVIQINGVKCERKIEISLPPCDNCNCPEKKVIDIRAVLISAERKGGQSFGENEKKEIAAHELKLSRNRFMKGNTPFTAAKAGNKPNNLAVPVGETWSCGNGKTVIVKCKTTWELSDLFQCTGKECEKGVRYTLSSAGEIVKTGKLPDRIQFNTAGNYTLQLTGTCGKNTCTVCEQKITVLPCENCDTCQLTAQYVAPLLNSNGDFVSDKSGMEIECGKTYYTFCKQDVLFLYKTECGKEPALSPGKTKIEIKNTANGNLSTYYSGPGGFASAVKGFSAGLYEVTVYSYAPRGDRDSILCKVCSYFIKTLCECDCTENKITELAYKAEDGDETPFECGKNLQLKCNTKYSFSAGNSVSDCKLLKGYVITNGTDTWSGYGSIRDQVFPEGNYQISFYTFSGNMTNPEFCDSCKINVTVTCNDCACGDWKNIVARFSFNKEEKVKDLNCGDSLEADCNKPVKLTATYNCAGSRCDKVLLYYVEGPDGESLVSGESLPVNFTPTKSGIYKIILRANCGSGACPDCIIYVKVTCEPPPCDFCIDFKEASFTQKSYAYSGDNNQLTLTQALNIPSRYKIKQIKAELVAFDWETDNADCRKCQKNSMAFGVLQEAILKANGIDYEGVAPGVIFNTHELDINCLPASGAQLGSGSNLKLTMSLPWQTSLSCCGDKFSFCIRYTIVTADCKVCTIIKCYTDVPERAHKKLNSGDGTGN